MSSEHDIAVALRNSLQVWLLAEDLHKIRPDNIPAWLWEKAHPF